MDFDRFPIEASSLVFVTPGSIHYWDQPQSIKGYSLSFLADFLQSQGHVVDLYAECPPFDPLYSRPVLKLGDLATEKVDAYFQEMVHEFNAKLDGYQSVIAAYLRLLLAEIRRFLHQQPQILPSHRFSNQTARFLRKLSSNPFKTISASEISRQLGISRSWLNQLVRHETGKNLTEHLQERLLLEAKRLLAHSQMNVSEIAYVLGFRDASYFTRLFRRIEKCSPREFREAFQDS